MDAACRTLPDLFWGYGAIFLFIVIYLFYLGIKISRLEKKVLEK